ncbi:hypothetical protein CY34DRAFT_19578 [Suillus luteus UH-Slu-Lm8-n1]|uniref:Uncharacterized protein n=1 Tax=Suillus luteus UH-Slu-Lm8-n1 TaxID=930992 RepID=A0A0D0A0R8_9AGAM|nr:hypothetical protein CY34DRAFT_19578 [Suillus luteus UH-Slu-Lm8-n1]
MSGPGCATLGSHDNDGIAGCVLSATSSVSSSNLRVNDNVKPWFPSESIAMSIEWLDDIMHSNFWVKCKGYAGVATQGTAKDCAGVATQGTAKPPACAGGRSLLPQAGGAVKARGGG